MYGVIKCSVIFKCTNFKLVKIHVCYVLLIFDWLRIFQHSILNFLFVLHTLAYPKEQWMRIKTMVVWKFVITGKMLITACAQDANVVEACELNCDLFENFFPRFSISTQSNWKFHCLSGISCSHCKSKIREWRRGPNVNR